MVSASSSTISTGRRCHLPARRSTGMPQRLPGPVQRIHRQHVQRVRGAMAHTKSSCRDGIAECGMGRGSDSAAPRVSGMSSLMNHHPLRVFRRSSAAVEPHIVRVDCLVAARAGARITLNLTPPHQNAGGISAVRMVAALRARHGAPPSRGGTPTCAGRSGAPIGPGPTARPSASLSKEGPASCAGLRRPASLQRRTAPNHVPGITIQRHRRPRPPWTAAPPCGRS